MRYTVGGYSGGKTAAQARLLRENPRAGAIVKGVKTLDILVAMGVPPSQIVLASELRAADNALMWFMEN